MFLDTHTHTQHKLCFMSDVRDYSSNTALIHQLVIVSFLTHAVWTSFSQAPKKRILKNWNKTLEKVLRCGFTAFTHFRKKPSLHLVGETINAHLQLRASSLWFGLVVHVKDKCLLVYLFISSTNSPLLAQTEWLRLFLLLEINANYSNLN